MTPIKQCGYDDVRPLNGQPGRYVCSKCGKIMRKDYPHHLDPRSLSELNKRKPHGNPVRNPSS